MVKVSYDEEYIPRFVTIDLSPTLSLTFNGIEHVEMEDLEEFKDCMITNRRSHNIGCGQNSNWNMFCFDGSLHINVNVNSSMDGCSIKTSIVHDYGVISKIDELIDVRRCIEEKIRYERY